MREHESIGANRPPERCSGGRPLVSCCESSGGGCRWYAEDADVPHRAFTWRRPVGRFGKPQQILFSRAERTCGRIHKAPRSECAVAALGRRPRGLRLAEEVQQLSLSELSEGCVGTLGSQRRIASEAALALGARPQLEQQSKFVLPVDRDTARGIYLPQVAVYDNGGSCQGRGLVVTPAQAAGEGSPPPEP